MKNEKKKNTVRYDIPLIKSAVDMVEIAESFGLRTSKRGNITLIECPNPAHHDTHLGNAYIRRRNGKDKFFCHACQIHESHPNDIIGFVQLVKGCSFTEALDFLSSYYGGLGRSETDDPEYRKKQEEYRILRKRMPSKELLAILGLESVPVRIERAISYSGEPCSLEKKTILLTVDGEDGNEYDVICENIDSNPLRSLLQNDPEAFDFLIMEHAKDKLAWFNNLRFIILNKYRLKEPNRVDQLIWSAAETVGIQTLINVCDSGIRLIEDYLIENDMEVPDVRQKDKPTTIPNIFGKISLGAV